MGAYRCVCMYTYTLRTSLFTLLLPHHWGTPALFLVVRLPVVLQGTLFSHGKEVGKEVSGSVQVCGWLEEGSGRLRCEGHPESTSPLPLATDRGCTSHNPNLFVKISENDLAVFGKAAGIQYLLNKKHNCGNSMILQDS